ncbi:MAG: diguanylate cyclase [Clostridia bacterium]|nr:diguanylate cyclase [Clostridia bacterium]
MICCGLKILFAKEVIWVENIWREYVNLFGQIKKIRTMSKSSKDSEDYKAFIYAEDARARANLKRMVPAMLLIFVFSTYAFFLKVNQYSIKSTQGILYICLFVFLVVLSIVYLVFIANIMNKSTVNIKKSKWVYMSFWGIFEFSICLVAVLQYSLYGHIESWFVFLTLALVAPVFDKNETAFILIISEIFVILTAVIIGTCIIRISLIAIPFLLISGLLFQTTYIGRMKVLLAQSKIEQRGYVVEKRMQGILEDLFDEVYEVNLNKNEFILVRNKGTFQSSHMRDSYEKSMEHITETLLHPDDVEQYTQKFSIDNIKNEFREGKKQIYQEARRRRSNGEYAWTSTLMIREYTENKDEFRLMQLLQDIDNRKTSEVKLKTAAQMDPLTKLYNKTTTKFLIEEYIAGEGSDGSHAFIIIDMDEFKSINDTHGHFVGDDVLLELSNELKSYFRESDILGRIGGDEFVAFIKNVQSVALVCDKVQRLSASYKKYGIDHNYSHKLSTSMGISMFNKDGATYDELYKNADKALYEAKRNGKDQYKFCIRNYQ